MCEGVHIVSQVCAAWHRLAIDTPPLTLTLTLTLTPSSGVPHAIIGWPCGCCVPSLSNCGIGAEGAASLAIAVARLTALQDLKCVVSLCIASSALSRTHRVTAP